MTATIALAGILLLTFPDPHQERWRTNDEYPAKALRERREGTVHFTVTVGIEGKAHQCTVTESSGSPDLDSAACKIILRRGRWNPAQDEQGKLVEAAFSSKFVWKIPR